MRCKCQRLLAYRTHTCIQYLHTQTNTGLMPPSFLCVSLQDDHKLTLDELNRKYGTDLNNVSEITRSMCCVVSVFCFCFCSYLQFLVSLRNFERSISIKVSTFITEIR